MDVQNNILQEIIEKFQKDLAKCLLAYNNVGAKEAYSKIMHIKQNFLNQPQRQEEQDFQDLLDKCSSEECDWDHRVYLRGRIGACYLYGNGVDKNEDAGVKLLQEAANEINCMCAYSDLDCYFREKNEATFLKNLKAYPEIYSEGVDNAI